MGLFRDSSGKPVGVLSAVVWIGCWTACDSSTVTSQKNRSDAKASQQEPGALGERIAQAIKVNDPERIQDFEMNARDFAIVNISNGWRPFPTDEIETSEQGMLPLPPEKLGKVSVTWEKAFREQWERALVGHRETLKANGMNLDRMTCVTTTLHPYKGDWHRSHFKYGGAQDLTLGALRVILTDGSVIAFLSLSTVIVGDPASNQQRIGSRQKWFDENPRWQASEIVRKISDTGTLMGFGRLEEKGFVLNSLMPCLLQGEPGRSFLVSSGCKFSGLPDPATEEPHQLMEVMLEWLWTIQRSELWSSLNTRTEIESAIVSPRTSAPVKNVEEQTFKKFQKRVEIESASTKLEQYRVERIERK